jgi:hypothetical protein
VIFIPGADSGMSIKKERDDRRPSHLIQVLLGRPFGQAQLRATAINDPKISNDEMISRSLPFQFNPTFENFTNPHSAGVDTANVFVTFCAFNSELFWR